MVFAHYKLDRTCALVIHSLGQRHRLLTHRLARCFTYKGRRRFFNHFLVSALNRAFTFVQIQNIAVAVADQLNFNMAGFFNKLLDEHPIIAKAVACLVTATREAFQRFLVVKSHTQALAAAACTGFNHDWVANTLGNFNCFFSAFNGLINTRNAIHPCGTGQLFRLNLVAHCSNGIVLRADKDDAFFFNPL